MAAPHDLNHTSYFLTNTSTEPIMLFQQIYFNTTDHAFKSRIINQLLFYIYIDILTKVSKSHWEKMIK